MARSAPLPPSPCSGVEMVRDLHEVLGPELFDMHCCWISWQIVPPVNAAERAEVARLAYRWNQAVDGLDVPTPGVR